jgi:hypothetical protein
MSSAMYLYSRAERRASPKPARDAGRKAGVPSGDRPAYPLDEGFTCF